MEIYRILQHCCSVILQSCLEKGEKNSLPWGILTQWSRLKPVAVIRGHDTTIIVPYVQRMKNTRTVMQVTAGQGRLYVLQGKQLHLKMLQRSGYRCSYFRQNGMLLSEIKNRISSCPTLQRGIRWSWIPRHEISRNINEQLEPYLKEVFAFYDQIG